MAHVEMAGVWKKFQKGQMHDSLRDLIPALARRLVGRRPPGDQLGARDFWAVRDLSFAVPPGEALGIIGPNGAGKSTVLKLLTGILRPTRGRVRLTGRVGALIEVAAGFHGDLTGRENVFLQGAIMGMRKAEIERRFDDIVEFSGIAPFIDTPVKRYSSGMNARLGFSLAAHLDPEILIIDEVLAVGDFAFQQRAFERIAEMTRRQIPVVVVSHQLDRIATLCSSAILLKEGSVALRGTPAECIAQYVHDSAQVEASQNGSGHLPVVVRSVHLLTNDAVASGERFGLVVRGVVRPRPAEDGSRVAIRIRAAHTGHIVYSTHVGRLGIELPEDGPFAIEFDLQANLPAGIYSLEFSIWDRVIRKRIGDGPLTYVRVEDKTGFSGSVQLNVHARLGALDA